MILLVEVLRDPAVIRSLDETRWDLLIRQARATALLAHLYQRFLDDDLHEAVPGRPLRHLRSEHVLAERQREAVYWEVAEIHKALEPIGVPIILLKGAAYLQAGLSPSRGRFFSDIDILVPRTMLGETERLLQHGGWITTHHNDYDQMYYRRWMHEIPPMRHIGRQSTIDVHHNILPLTARLHPDPEALIKASVRINDELELYALCPADMVLHSATHLFHDGELEHGLRDLVDLDRLLREFSQIPGFWDTLVQRGETLNLIRPLHYALRYTSHLLQTPVPASLLDSAPELPPPALQRFMDGLFLRALAPAHSSCNDWFTGTARWLLYLRSHYLRMPLYLLVPHLFHKSVITPYKEFQEARKTGPGSTHHQTQQDKETEIDVFQ